MDLALEPLPADYTGIEISLRGLLGGHSGMDIHLGRGNSNKLMNRLLYHLVSIVDLRLVSLHGGSLRNAIPRESTAVVAVHKDVKTQVLNRIESFTAILTEEYQSIETEMKWSVNDTTISSQAVAQSDFEKILHSIYAVPNGVFRMSPDMADLVETSSSLAKVDVADGKYTTQSLQRSSVDSTKADVANAVRAAFESNGIAVVQNGEYPGWKPLPDSDIVQLMTKLYRARFNEEPQVKACHAGLECGILGKHFPKMEMISFGPNIHGAHSPDEKVQISSVQKYWGLYLETLKNIPVK
jgi:dipeptidase D